MKLLKEYKTLLENEYTEKDPEFYGITNYTWNDDGTLDVDGNVNLDFKKLKELPFKFGKVNGDFYCSNNNLTSLEGAPREVGGEFSCSNNNLTSLEGAPIKVGGSFYCSYNPELTKLKRFPRKIGGDVYIYNCGRNFDEEYIKRRCDVGGVVVYAGEM